MTNFKYIILFILLTTFFDLKSQQIPISNQYLVNKTAINPSFTGFSGNIESFISYRQSWVGVQGAPTTAFLNINGAMTDNMGLGFSAMTDKTGNFSQIFLSATYAYHIRFSDNFYLSAGISPMYFRNQLNLSSINSYGSQLDPMLQNIDGLAINAFDAGISLGITAKTFRFGISVPQTIGMTFKFNDIGTNFGLKRHYFGFMSYMIKTGNFSFEPLVLVRTTEKSPINYGGSVMFKFKDKVWGNIGYSADNSILLSVGVLSGNSLVLNYSYEVGIGGISKTALGTHELTVGFLIKPAKVFKSDATVFTPSESNIQVDDNLTNKIAVLEDQIKREKQDRINKDVDLQRQIDSLKQYKFVQNNTNNTVTPSSINWIQKVVTHNISFGFMNAILLPSSKSELDKYVQKMRQYPDMKVKIMVYTDNLFSEQVNKQVSEMRAKAIYDYFVSIPDINAANIEFHGMGAVDPIADNTTPEGREQNNRVEILFSTKVF